MCAAIQKVLLVHNAYQARGGEDVVIENEGELLRRNGCEVGLATVSNEAIEGPWQKLKTAWTLPYSSSAREWLAGEITVFRPDIVHFHNTFPLLTPAVYDACVVAGVAAVQTLHNYRTVCGNALLMREARPCEDCIGGSPYQAVVHRCYRNSRFASLAMARSIAYHRARNTWRAKVDRFIALTEFARSRFVAGGLPADKIVIKPNFVPDRRPEGVVDKDRKGALFVGRLVAEKGIETMVKAWSSVDLPLRIIGDGPMLPWLEQNAPANMTVLGRRAPDEVAAEMARATFLLMPSEWYEGFPLTLIEAYCQGLPVICSRLGAMEELVSDGVTGLHFISGDACDLAAKATWAHTNWDAMVQMSRNARNAYKRFYTPDTNYPQLMAIYEQAVSAVPRRLGR